MSKTEKTRNEMLQEWLNENVQVFPTPKKIKLTNFEVLWEHLSGSFNMTLDGVFINERMNFLFETKKNSLYGPKDKNYRFLGWCGMTDIENIYHGFYDDSNFYLNRKKETFDKVIDIIKDKKKYRKK